MTTWSRSHFEVIAAHINAARALEVKAIQREETTIGGGNDDAEAGARAAIDALDGLAQEFCGTFERANGLFKSSLFLKACGLPVAETVPGKANHFKVTL